MKPKILPIDLQQGVVPISAAAAHLAALIKQARSTRQPIVITQKGYPSGVILSIPVFTALRELAEAEAAEETQSAGVACTSLPRPKDVIDESIAIMQYKGVQRVHIAFRDTHENTYILDLPYRLDGGGRAYTFASIDAPEPMVSVNDSTPRPITADEVGAFGAWCQVADHHLDR